MSRRMLLFDVSRLLSRSGLAAPTGIDRVDLAYLRALTAWPDFDCRFTAIDDWGVQLLSRRSQESLCQQLESRWNAPEADSPVFAPLCDWLAHPAGERPASRLRVPGRDTEPLPRRLLRTLAHPAGALRLRWQLARAPQPLYVNTSHGRLFQNAAARWLDAAQAAGVFFVHDLIPITHPQYNRPREPARHAARLRTIAAHAAAVIVNSSATREALSQWWREHQLREPDIHVLPLGISDRFSAAPPALRPALPYFVAVGTLEPRKNHQLLLDLWRRWTARSGMATPRLLLIGRRGWLNQRLFEQLDRDPALAGTVAEVSGLADHEVVALVRGARALLNPSFAEGYGLPVAEALACGTPALVSDLAAHREVGGGAAEYLDPTDAASWEQALLDYARPRSPRRRAALDRLRLYRTPGWDQHFIALHELLRHIGRHAG